MQTSGKSSSLREDIVSLTSLSSSVSSSDALLPTSSMTVEVGFLSCVASNALVYCASFSESRLERVSNTYRSALEYATCHYWVRYGGLSCRAHTVIRPSPRDIIPDVAASRRVRNCRPDIYPPACRLGRWSFQYRSFPG